MISAKDAYEISAPKQYLDFIEEKIKEAAEKGETSVTIRKEPYARWLVNEEEKLEDAAKMVITKLRECGYHLSLFWKESQFVDFGLVIDWSKAGKQS
nr:MAG TPA: hypothetical protein [Caudoviricetes sp.]